MGLLAIVMTPLQAAAFVVLPTFVTNIWQLVAGPSLWPIVVRLWPMIATLCLGIWAGAGLMTGSHSRYGTVFLGVTLLIYALTAWASLHIKVQKAHEPWLGPIIGAVTGIITAATGVFMIPSVPYLQAIGFEKEDLVQALGLTFTVGTVALSVNLALAGALKIALAGPTLGVLAMAGLGMWARTGAAAAAVAGNFSSLVSDRARAAWRLSDSDGADPNATGEALTAPES